MEEWPFLSQDYRIVLLQLDISEVDMLDNEHTKSSKTNLLLYLIKHPINFTMVLTGPQTTALFNDTLQMGLSDRTCAYLATEGINIVDDIGEFNGKGACEKSLEVCNHPLQIPDTAKPSNMIHHHPFNKSAKSVMRLEVAAIVVEYYDHTDRLLTAGEMVWNSHIKNFQAQWNSIMDLKEDESQYLSKMENNFGIVKWLKSYDTYLQQKIWVRNYQIAYVIQ